MNLTHSAILCVALATAAVQPATAKDHGTPASTASPYAGMERQPVKALSDEEIADLRAGRGMGLALPAELNGYPGPSHVLELADALQLSDEQRAKTKTLFEAMKAETIPIGERIIADETTLDRLFAEKRVTPASLSAATARIGAAQGNLRAAHLRYHLAMMDVLSPEQVVRYVELRGYAAAGDGHDHGKH
jgi:Spy/CpxP family protein refolding chaperone